MIKFFRKIRQKLLGENKFSKYLLYAVGEIVLLVLGILIALQINNNNEARKTKIKEHNYLSGIKADLQLNLNELKNYIVARETSLNSAGIILEYFEENKEIDANQFNLHNLNVQIWSFFNENDNTFQELLYSGNLAIISNDSIKNILLDMQLGYRNIDYIESHMRHDFENYVYPIYFSLADLNNALKNYSFQMSDGMTGELTEQSKKEIKILLESQTLKNGFVLSIFNNNLLIQEYNTMIEMTKKLIRMIDSELLKKRKK